MITTTLSAEFADGVADLATLEPGIGPHQLPRYVRDRDADAQLRLMEAQPSGAYVAVETEARRIELDAHATRAGFRMMHAHGERSTL